MHLLKGGRKVAAIFNAVDFLDPEQRKNSAQQELERLRSLDLDYTEIDLRTYFDEAHKSELQNKLNEYDAVWMRGGNCFILRRALRQSGADEIIKTMLNTDSIVYGGYSAGIDMLTPSLHGAELVDDPNLIPDGYSRNIVWECLGILPFAVAPHYKSDHPESADIDKSVEYMVDNHIPFIALRDGEAIVIEGENQRVVG